ncbi:MAG: glycosyltransferase family 2 protein, partial [Actinomycetes bacterium]
TINRALESLQAQTESSWEAIVIDDGSTDGTSSAVSNMQDTRIRLLPSSVHGGASQARNRGIADATGEWIGLLDADDEWLPERLARLLEIANDIQADVVSDDLVLRNHSGRALGTTALARRSFGNQPRIVNKVDYVKYDLAITQPLIRRRLFDEVAWREDLAVTEDFHLGYDLLDHGALWFQTLSPMYIYYTGGGVTSRQDSQMVNDAAASVDALARAVDNDPELQKALFVRARTLRDFGQVCELRSLVQQKALNRVLRHAISNPSISYSVVRQVVAAVGWRLSSTW